MKSLRKSILTLLALTLFGGAGAWAQGPTQGPTQVTQLTTDMLPASWATDENNITLADLQAIGFVATDYNTAAAWTGAPQDGSCYLYYAISGSGIAYAYFTAGSVNDHDQSQVVRAALYHDISQGAKYFYTGSPAIELTKKGANQWTLGQTPDYDLELQVEYYQKYALKEIPAGWTVMVNGQDSTNRIVEGSLLITETDAVTLIPDGNPRRVKSVELVEPLQSLFIGGDVYCTLYYRPGETWGQAIQHPENTGFGSESNYIIYFGYLIYSGSNQVYTDTPVNPTAQYQAAGDD